MAERNNNLPAGNQLDRRRPIRVDGHPDQASVAAMLRRAFAAGRQEESDDAFADLLARIH
jgi:hypothetical protein